MLLRNFLEDTSFHYSVSRTREVVEHFIHLLECFAIRLGHAEPSPEAAEQAEDSEEDVRPEPSPLHKWRCYEADNEVPEPVVAGSDGDTFGAQ